VTRLSLTVAARFDYWKSATIPPDSLPTRELHFGSLARELGIDPAELAGSAWVAAAISFGTVRHGRVRPGAALPLRRRPSCGGG
jgi:hypothetical protein